MRLANLCFLAILTTATILGGCTMWVNIPAHGGDRASHDPNTQTVLNVQLQALRAVHESVGLDSSLYVFLVPGSTPASYRTVVPEIASTEVGKALVRWGGDGPQSGDIVLEARQIRIRGGEAEVDVIRPSLASQPTKQRALATVSLRYDCMVGWYVTDQRVWRLPVEEALLESMRQADLKPPQPQ